MIHTLSFLSIIVLTIGSLNMPQQAVEPTRVYFAQSGHHLDDSFGFLRFWRANGQLPVFGFPITEVLFDNGVPIQYFERARFEYDALTNSIMLGLVGKEVYGQAPSNPQGAAGRYVPETGHTIDGEFLEYWETHNGLRFLGYPLSEAFEESGLLVQVFERGRLEYHPEALRPLWKDYQRIRGIDLDPLYEILRSDVGRRSALNQGIDLSPVPQQTGIPHWSPQLWPQSLYVSLSDYTLEAYEGDLRVLMAPIAIGKPGFETVTGTFKIQRKWPEKDMRGHLRNETWDVPAVPFTQFFYRDWAIHGTYWHDSFGTRRSHGCVNLPLEHAEWLYNWTQGSPNGTSVTVEP